MNLENLLKNIYKVYSYKATHIRRRDVSRVLELAMTSSLVENPQALAILIINTPEDKALIKEILEKRKFQENLNFLMTAPYIFLVFGDTNYEFWRENVWAALSVMTIAAAETGFVTLPTMLPSTVEMNKAFSVPSNYRFVAALSLGIPERIVIENREKSKPNIIDRTQKMNDVSTADGITVPFLDTLNKSNIFSHLNIQERHEIIKLFHPQPIELNKNEQILKKGDPPRAFFLILSGTFEIVGHDGIGNERGIAALREGDCFGEMSILCQEPVSTSVRASSKGSLLVMMADRFLSMLQDYPSLNLYFIKLIAQRLRKTNLKLVQESIIQGITGELSSISLAEIVQTIDMSGKNGILQIESFQGEKGILGLREGRILYARCGDLKGEEAVFHFLSWGSGQFRFIQGEFQEQPNIGMDTMGLLMEGCRRMDEKTKL
ncbi:MAG: DUF4388 domain-containing protein [Candidatus Brocadiae bacterium]|nr:DUF4388 domain-containing protein [Candidatus Brocadiia bacterium]